MDADKLFDDLCARVSVARSSGCSTAEAITAVELLLYSLRDEATAEAGDD